MDSPKEAPVALVVADEQPEPSAESAAPKAFETQDSPAGVQDASSIANRPQSGQELARAISSIVEKLEPWKALMSGELRRELDILGKTAESLDTTGGEPKQ
jgi:hypothetical protein